MMKISKGKRQLAQLLIEAGVTKFPDGANWSAQDKAWNKYTKCAMFYSGGDAPEFRRGYTAWRPLGNDCFLLTKERPVALPALINNWHQTVLSRDEFDQIVAETVQDADGWIEWNGGEGCPVYENVAVHVKFRNGDHNITGMAASRLYWKHDNCFSDIIAYRLHKPEQSKPEFCESVTRSIPEPAPTPTIDQLLQEWRNSDDFAKRKQAEADEASSMRDERWQAVQARAGDMGVTVVRCESVAAEPEPVKPATTGNFRNAKIGSPKHYISNKGWSDEICDECGKRFGAHFDTDCNRK